MPRRRRSSEKRQQQAHDGAAAGRDDDARQQQPRRGPAAGTVRDREYEQHRSESAWSRPRRRRRNPAAPASMRPSAPTAAPPETPSNVGIGKRVAQERLHQDAREREHDAGAERRERPRQAQLPENRAHERIAGCKPLPGASMPELPSASEAAIAASEAARSSRINGAARILPMRAL